MEDSKETKVYKVSKENEEIHDADFETAISATKFGKFNILLFVFSIPGGWTAMIENSSMSYVFPAAHCQLDLSLNDRGALNAMTFAGMVVSGFGWGFLCDLLGRKKLMVIGYILHALIVIASSFSQTFVQLLVFKFFGGFIINGPLAALTTYLSEFHSAQYRSKVQLYRGLTVSLGTVLLPLCAWGILPQDIKIQLSDNLTLNSWNIFLIVCSIPSIFGGLIFIFMPESPKFLMTTGRTEDALSVLRKVYQLNTTKNKNNFAIKSLMDETKLVDSRITAKRSTSLALREGLHQIKPLFLPPYLKNLLIVFMMYFLITIALNTLRLWLPQIFQSISDYEYYNNKTSDICTMLEALTSGTPANASCHVNFSGTVYQSNMIVGGVTMLGYILASIIINKVGKKLMLVVLSVVGGTCVICNYFSINTESVVALSSIFLSSGSVCSNIILTIVVDLFPTSLRASTISLVIIVGRVASMIGNLCFPFLLSLGCAPPFFTIGAIGIAYSILIVFLPNTELEALK